MIWVDDLPLNDLGDLIQNPICSWLFSRSVSGVDAACSPEHVCAHHSVHACVAAGGREAGTSPQRTTTNAQVSQLSSPFLFLTDAQDEIIFIWINTESLSL